MRFNIKYIFYGESTAMIGMGRWDYLVKQTLIDRNWVEEHSGMNGLRVSDILDFTEAEEMIIAESSSTFSDN